MLRGVFSGTQRINLNVLDERVRVGLNMPPMRGRRQKMVCRPFVLGTGALVRSGLHLLHTKRGSKKWLITQITSVREW